MIAAEVDVVTDDAGLDRLAAEWEALWRRVPTRSVFQSPAWLLSWWKQFGTSRPIVAVLRDGNGLVGVLPLYVLTELGGGSKLLPIGVGLSDEFDALIAADAPIGAAEVLLSRSLDMSLDASVCDLLDLSPHSALIDAPLPRDWQSIALDGETCPILTIPSGTTDLDAIVGANTRRKLRMNRHRANRIGGWTTRAADAGTLSEGLDVLVRFHQSRWKSRGSAGVFADPRVERLHRAAAPRLLEAGVLRLMTVRVNASLAAACMAFVAPPDRISLYLSGFDEDFASVSPGTLLLGDMIEGAIEDGTREIHFLRGGEAYKYAWGGIDRRNVNRHLTRRR